MSADGAAQAGRVEMKARKGDFCAYEVHRSYVSQTEGRKEWSEILVGRIEGATRQGTAKTIRQARYGTLLTIGTTRRAIGRLWVIPAATVDAEALLRAFSEGDAFEEPFETLAEVKEAVGPFRI